MRNEAKIEEMEQRLEQTGKYKNECNLHLYVRNPEEYFGLNLN